MDFKWTERPTNGTRWLEQFADCAGVRIVPYGTGVLIEGFDANGRDIARITSDTPTMAVDVMRYAFADKWRGAAFSIAADVDRHYAKGGRNWAGD